MMLLLPLLLQNSTKPPMLRKQRQLLIIQWGVLYAFLSTYQGSNGPVRILWAGVEKIWKYHRPSLKNFSLTPRVELETEFPESHILVNLKLEAHKMNFSFYEAKNWFFFLKITRFYVFKSFEPNQAEKISKFLGRAWIFRNITNRVGNFRLL